MVIWYINHLVHLSTAIIQCSQDLNAKQCISQDIIYAAHPYFHVFLAGNHGIVNWAIIQNVVLAPRSVVFVDQPKVKRSLRVQRLIWLRMPYHKTTYLTYNTWLSYYNIRCTVQQ